MYPSFGELGAKLWYKPPSEARKARHKEVARVCEALLEGPTPGDDQHERWQQAVVNAHEALRAPIGPRATPASTAAFNALQKVRMVGNQCLCRQMDVHYDVFLEALDAAVIDLFIACNLAIVEGE